MATRKKSTCSGQLRLDEPEPQTPPVARKRPASPSPLDRLLDAAIEIQQNPDAVERAYMARQLVQCTLPHSDPGDQSVWVRNNGHLTLAIRPNVDLRTRKPLYPYGSIPRLLLFWIVTEATQKKSRRIHLGNSLDAFMRKIGLNPRTGGGKRRDAKRLHDQMERLFRSTITFEDRREWGKSYVDMQVAPRGQFRWDPSRAHQDNIWESWVELGEDFFAAITAAPVPVDVRALRGLKRSPLPTAFAAGRKGTSRSIPWEGLHTQMGAEYAQVVAEKIEQRAERQVAEVREREAQELSRLDRLIAAARELAVEVKERAVAVSQHVADGLEKFRERMREMRGERKKELRRRPEEKELLPARERRVRLELAPGAGIGEKRQAFREWRAGQRKERESTVPEVKQEVPIQKPERSLEKDRQRKPEVQIDRGFSL